MKKILTLLQILCFSGLAMFAQDIEQVLEEKPLEVTGSIAAHTQFYNTNAPIDRSTPFGWNINGRANFEVYGFSMPVGFTIGRMVRNFSVPTFTQFGVSPSYKWATAHLGHRNMLFSKYTLNNHTFLGAGVELQPGIFRVSAMTGRLRKSFREVELEDQYLEPIYKRTAHALKFGIGKEDYFLDLIYFKAKDDPESLDIPDTLGITPAENTALGLRGKLTIARRLTLDTEVGMSGYTRNQESLGIDSADIAQDLESAGNFFEPRFSSQLGFAMNASLNYRHRGFYIGVQFERVEPSYQTMGSYFFNNDFQNLTGKAGWSMFKSRVRFDGTFGVQQNNVRNDRAVTNKRNIGSFNLVVRPTNTFGVNMNYSNYSQDQEPGRLSVNDTIRISTATHNLSITPSLVFRQSSIVASINYQKSDDKNPFNENFADVNSFYASINYHYFFNEGNSSLTAGVHTNDITFGDQEQSGTGFSGGATQTMAGGAIRLSLNATFQFNRIDQESNGNNKNVNFTGTYQINKNQSISVLMGYLQNENIFTPAFHELRGRIGYQYIFR